MGFAFSTVKAHYYYILYYIYIYIASYTELMGVRFEWHVFCKLTYDDET